MSFTIIEPSQAIPANHPSKHLFGGSNGVRMASGKPDNLGQVTDAA